MKIEPKTLAIVLPPGGNTDKPCWGRVAEEVTPRLFLVQVPKTKTPKGFSLPELIPVRAEFLVPLPRAGGFSKNNRLRRCVFEYVNWRFPRIAKDLFMQKKLPEQPAVLRSGTLVVVIKGGIFFRKPCWGIINKIMPSRGFDITLGRRMKMFGPARVMIFAEKNELVPVAETDGRGALTQRLIFVNMDKVIPLLLYWLQGKTKEWPST